jgi:hypothetical protein
VFTSIDLGKFGVGRNKIRTEEENEDEDDSKGRDKGFDKDSWTVLATQASKIWAIKGRIWSEAKRN